MPGASGAYTAHCAMQLDTASVAIRMFGWKERWRMLTLPFLPCPDASTMSYCRTLRTSDRSRPSGSPTAEEPHGPMLLRPAVA